MTRNKLIILLLLILLGGGYYWQSHHAAPAASEPAKEAAEAPKEGAPPADSTQISKEAADAAGIKTQAVGSATVAETITLAGRITLNQNATAQVKARFPGIVREVKKGQGESVSAGDVLATVESNDSLQVYPVKSPIGGIILARNTNIGNVAGEAPLFTIADVSNVWAEFYVFPRDIDKIKNGQNVHVTTFEGLHSGDAAISVVSPVAEASSQTIVARVTLPNTEGLWHSGMTVRGDVVITQKHVPLALKTSALQRMEGKTVVFVQTGDVYTMRPVKTGLSNNEWTEIREGLKEGEPYVSEKSFLIKADIGKAGAKDEN